MTDIKKIQIPEGRLPTPEEIIHLLWEQAFNSAKIGFSSHFDPQEFLSLFSIDDSSDDRIGPPAELENTVHTMTQEATNDWIRERRILRLMKDNEPILRQASLLLDKRLLAVGITPEDLESWKVQHQGLRAKAIKLYELEHPQTGYRPPQAHFKLCKQNADRVEKMDVYLSVKDNWTDTQAALHDLSSTFDCFGQMVKNRGSGQWMYQRLVGNKPLPGRTVLRDNRDWQDLLRVATNEDNKLPSAIIVQESTVTFVEQNAKEVNNLSKTLEMALESLGEGLEKSIDPLDNDNGGVLYVEGVPTYPVTELDDLRRCLGKEPLTGSSTDLKGKELPTG